MGNKTSKNHYVPKWYQRRFLPEGYKEFTYLDIAPGFIVLPLGKQKKRRDKYTRGPSGCFRQIDLYTTHLFGKPNDDIERYLFGSIDRRGSKAIEALADESEKRLTENFSAIFEYMDAQILRTPKGLNWISLNHGQSKQRIAQEAFQRALMSKMQSIRQMHCTMWVEGVMEIVSANKCDTKFILTDHPVTVYNNKCFPGSKHCRYPNEPPTAWVGTQTIFPLDLDRCFILTNLEYARKPKIRTGLTKPRTNARHHAKTYAMTNKIIRSRHLGEIEVATINYILKKRAKKYIAAVDESWLYPENILKSTMWNKLGKVLLPPSNELHRSGGEIYIGGDDDLIWYQDEFGHTPADKAAADIQQKKAQQMRADIERLLRKDKKR